VRPEHHRKREKGGDKEQHGHREWQSLASQPQAQEDEVDRQAPRTLLERAADPVLSPSAMMEAAQTTAKAAPASQGIHFQVESCNAPSVF
jgi:hypothetical protein